MPNFDNVEYWAKSLSESTDSIAPLLNKMYEEHCTLSIEDQYLLRELLSRQAAQVNLLNQDLAKPSEPKKLWQRITNK